MIMNCLLLTFCILNFSFISRFEALTPERRKNDLRPFCDCGHEDTQHKPRVVGGRDADTYEYPFASVLVSSRELRTSGSLTPFCGATLITDSHVLTAAHCVRERQPWNVDLSIGDYDVMDGDATIRSSVKLTKHPKYKRVGYFNDIAVVEFDEPVELGYDPYLERNIKAAWLPPADFRLEPGTTVTVYGWGRLDYYTGVRPRILQTLDIPVVSYDYCKDAFKSKIVERMMICAGGREGEDACIGDSGSGLLARFDNEDVLVGTVSFGRRCALPDVPGVYSNVSSYVDWIYEQTRSSGCHPCIAKRP